MSMKDQLPKKPVTPTTENSIQLQFSHSRAVVLMILVTLLWSIAGVVTRHLESAHSFEVTFWRSFFNGLALAIGLTALRGIAFWRQLRVAPWQIWFSGCCWAVMFTAFMVALTLTSVANVLITMAVGPLVTALFGRVFLRRHLPPRTWAAIILASLGIVWMFGSQTTGGASLLGTLVATAVPIAGAANWTVLNSVARRQFSGIDRNNAAPSSEEQPDMLVTVWIGATISSLLTLPFAYPFASSAHDLSLLAMLGVVQLAIPCLMVVWLAKVLPAPEIALLALLEVLFGVLWAWLGANEAPPVSALAGGSLVIGALLVNELLGWHAGAAARG